jgi:hypothetical protein
MGSAMTEENTFLLMRERDSELLVWISGTWRLQNGRASIDGRHAEGGRLGQGHGA